MQGSAFACVSSLVDGPDSLTQPLSFQPASSDYRTYEGNSRFCWIALQRDSLGGKLCGVSAEPRAALASANPAAIRPTDFIRIKVTTSGAINSGTMPRGPPHAAEAAKPGGGCHMR